MHAYGWIRNHTASENADPNGDGVFDLSDPIYVLLYLFFANGPPVGWRDRDFDGVAEPTCRLAPATVCASANAVCQ